MKPVLTFCALLTLILAASAGRWSDWKSNGPCKSVHQQRKDLNGVDPHEGIQTRTRFCLQEEDALFPDYEEEMVLQEECEVGKEESEKQACRISTIWTSFTPQSECSVSCGTGKKEMRRECIQNTDKIPDNGKIEMCQLGSEQTILTNCRIRPCAVNGGWSEWSSWGSCGSAKCHFPKPSDIQGETYSVRTCSKPAPKYGGKMCDGPFLKAKKCLDPVNCPTDGNWSDWGPWNIWNCEDRRRNKTRTCDYPPPRNGGKKCDGNAFKFSYEDKNEDSFIAACGQVNVEDLDPEEEVKDPVVEEDDEPIVDNEYN